MAKRRKRSARAGRTSTGRIKRGFRLTRGGSVVKSRKKARRRRGRR